jgi:hypothetical protein
MERPKCISGRWYVEADTKEFGRILVLSGACFLNPVNFNTAKEAQDFIDIRKKQGVTI